MPATAHALMNVESAVALALLALIVWRSRAQTAGDAARLWPLAVVAGLTVAAFAGFLSFPLLADDYTHIWNARHFNWAAGVAHFTHAEPDRFFRPLVYWAFAAEAPWAGLNPAIWRGMSLLWHAASAVMVYLLLRRMGAATAGCAAGAGVFAISGTRPEAVTWVGARFDLMAAAFGLAALLVLLAGRPLVSTLLLVAALLSKESAFVLPLLAGLLLWYERGVVRRAWPWFAAAAAVFGFRMWVLGGIGGYQNAGAGTPTVFNFRFATLNGWLARSWAAMFFPVNWSHAPGIALYVLMALALGSLAWLAWRGANRRMAVTGIAFFLIAALPAHQFLMIGSDLEKSRVLYLPSIGFAILVASLVRGKHAWIPATALVGFQLAALWHNLPEWRATGELAGKTCAAIAAQPGPIPEQQFPNVVNGVYFLKTGYPACVWLLKPER